MRRWMAGAVGVALGFTSSLAVMHALAPTQSMPESDTCLTGTGGQSVARQWDEAALEAIRRDLPAPTVHARNLFHLSAAMWDAWAAYEVDASGYYLDEEVTRPPVAEQVRDAQIEAVSYAAYRVLESRYLDSVGASDSIPVFDALMSSLCLDVAVKTTSGDSPAAVGNRVAESVLAATAEDGSGGPQGYTDDSYRPVNPPLRVAETGTRLRDPNRWQPLRIEQMVSQNGIPVPDDVQQFIGPHWGHVDSFALPDGGRDGLPLDPGRPPMLGHAANEAEFQRSAVEVLRYSSMLDPDDGEVVDISPASVGGNSLGSYDGGGYELNPVSGAPYESNRVLRADFARAVAEFWADGPDSETPPGHWNVLANEVSDRIDAHDLRIGAVGPVVDRLEWDVTLYFALNAAVHDAAVAAWGAKGHYDYVRPISMIRHLGGLGQSSRSDLRSFHRQGLRLSRGLVEVVTARSTRPGGRHEALAGSEGKIAVHAWTGRPQDPETQVGGVGWILAQDWVPYQMPTFVTPAFAGYVSGHSAFSRAGAAVLTEMTGSRYFPGGMGEWTVPAGSLEFEAGPSQDVALQWATYADAADQAGLSRLYGGIHVRADDLGGRAMGQQCGEQAWAKVQDYRSSSA